MKVSYKAIRIRNYGRQVIDHYYGLTLDDFLTDDDLRFMQDIDIASKLRAAHEREEVSHE